MNKMPCDDCYMEYFRINYDGFPADVPCNGCYAGKNWPDFKSKGVYKMENKIKVYISHSIRGQKGKDATHDDMVQNNQRAITFGAVLSCKFPHIDFYVPGEHDRFVLIAYESGMLTEKQILEVDCQILKDHHILLNYIHDQYISGGMLKENMCAQENGIPILMAKDVDAAEKVLNRKLDDIKRNGK